MATFADSGKDEKRTGVVHGIRKSGYYIFITFYEKIQHSKQCVSNHYLKARLVGDNSYITLRVIFHILLLEKDTDLRTALNQ